MEESHADAIQRLREQWEVEELTTKLMEEKLKQAKIEYQMRQLGQGEDPSKAVLERVTSELCHITHEIGQALERREYLSREELLTLLIQTRDEVGLVDAIIQKELTSE
jgi:hypothetical protein